MSEQAATPAEQINGTPPVAPTATPAAPAVIPPPAPVSESVTLTKEVHDQLARDAARAASNQRKADLYDRTVGSKGNSHFKPAAPVAPPTPDEQAAAGAAEDRKAEQGLMRLALDPAYREVLDNDVTLRDLLTKNPLAILPVFAPDALDAEDAVSLVKEALDKRRTPATPPAPATPPPVAPPAGGVNPSDQAVNEAYEEARKVPNTENALAGMIGAKLKLRK